MTQNVWESYMKPFRILGNLYFIGTKLASSHLIDTGCGLILIDTGYPETLYLLLDGIYRLGFSPNEIKYILHSHGHIDHIGGTRYLAELTGAKTFIGGQDAAAVTGRQNLTFAEELGMTFREPFQPDFLLGDGDTVRLGNTAVRCVHTPGHTQGTMSFFFDLSENGKTYRAGMHGGSGTNTLERTYLEQHGLPPSLRGAFRASLEKLKDERVDVFIGNHPEQCDTIGRFERIRNGETDAFIDPKAWGAFLDGCATRLDDLLEAEAT